MTFRISITQNFHQSPKISLMIVSQWYYFIMSTEWLTLIINYMIYHQCQHQSFFLGGTGGPPIRWKFCQSPHPTPVPVFGPRLVPTQPRFIPENLKNLNTFLCQIWLLLSSKVPLKSVLQLKIAKNGLILIRWAVLASVGFFSQVSPPPSDFAPVGDRWRPKILSPPHQKFREKTLSTSIKIWGGGNCDKEGKENILRDKRVRKNCSKFVISMLKPSHLKLFCRGIGGYNAPHAPLWCQHGMSL